MQPKARQLYDRLLVERRVGGYGWGSFGQRVYGFCSSQVIAQTPLLSEQATIEMLWGVYLQSSDVLLLGDGLAKTNVTPLPRSTSNEQVVKAA